MKKYNPDATCIKCGGGDIEDLHEVAWTPTEDIIRTAEIARSELGMKINSDPTPERIARTCKNCGYLWHELPMDGEPCHVADATCYDKAKFTILDEADTAEAKEALKKIMEKTDKRCTVDADGTIHRDGKCIGISPDAPVIEVGDVVTYDGSEYEYIIIAKDESKFCMRDSDGRLWMHEFSPALTLIRKGPKVHRIKDARIIAETICPSRGTQDITFRIKHKGSLPNKSTLTLTEEAS